MAFDEGLVVRVRVVMLEAPEMIEKKMFGGVGFLVRGNMACGVNQDYLIVRVGREMYEEALRQPHAGVFDMTGRPMTGWVMVDPAGCAQEKDLRDWVRKGIDFALTLPPK